MRLTMFEKSLGSAVDSPEALQAVDHKPRDERRVVVKVDDVRVDLTEYAKKNTHPAGRALMF